MKVTFTCDKCGTVLRDFDRPDPIKCKPVIEFATGFIPDCPNCAKLTYGPLTEEMVAEALSEAAGFGGGMWQYSHACLGQARFVLRLLNKVAEGWCGSEEELTQYWGDTREWLLDLARKS